MIGFELDGQFELRSLLGAGGMGFVYLARQVALGRPVAVKMLYGERSRDPATRERFRREAHALANLDHPHIVRVHAYGEAYGTIPYLVMERLQGQPLDLILQHAGRLAPTVALEVIAQMADALAAAHGAGVVHRDLKPENVQLDQVPGKLRARLLDFGLVLVSGDAEERRLTRQGTVFGTPEYMAPEQIRSNEVEPRTDLYALGVMLYEMLEGRPPFRAHDTTGTFEMHLNDPPPPLAESAADVASIDRALNELLSSLLEKAPGDRPESAREVMDRARALREQLPSPQGSLPTLRDVSARPPRSSRDITVDPESPSATFPSLLGDEHADQALRSALGASERRRRAISVAVALAVLPLLALLTYRMNQIWRGAARGEIARDETGRPLGFQPLFPLLKEAQAPSVRRSERQRQNLHSLLTGSAGAAEEPGGPAQMAYEASRHGVDRELASRGLRLRDVLAHPAAAVSWHAQDQAARNLTFDQATEALIAFQEIARELTAEEIVQARVHALALERADDGPGRRAREMFDKVRQRDPRILSDPASVSAFLRELDELESEAQQ